MSGFPTPAEELDRKVVTELERLIHGLETRAISVRHACESFQTIWNVAAGLIPRETMDLLTKVGNELAAKAKDMNRADAVAFVMGGGSGSYVVTRRKEVVTATGWIDTHHQDKHFHAPNTEVHPCNWASEKFDSVIDQFTQRGFVLAFKG